MTSITTTSMGTMPAPLFGGTGSLVLTDSGGSSVSRKSSRKTEMQIKIELFILCRDFCYGSYSILFC